MKITAESLIDGFIDEQYRQGGRLWLRYHGQVRWSHAGLSPEAFFAFHEKHSELYRVDDTWFVGRGFTEYVVSDTRPSRRRARRLNPARHKLPDLPF